MSTPLTSDQATALLRENPDAYRTPEALRTLAAQVDANASGRVTVLYSGPAAKGLWSSDVVNAMVEAGEDVRVIDRSEAARFLKSRDFFNAVAEVYDVPARPLISGTYRGPATDWLYHPTQGPWADASARFADATIGEVRTVVGDASPDRVFGATEVPRILANERVPTVEGIPHEALVTRQSSHGTQAAFEMIVARSREHVGLLRAPADVPINHDGKLLFDKTDALRLDSREYFAATRLEGKVPDFVGESRPLIGSMNPPTEYVRAGQVHLQELQLQSVQPHGAGMSRLVRGAGAAGVVFTAYDIADTAHDVSRLRAQGNDTAAAARIERFAVQNVGGWGGAAAGVAGGALAGVETGPGLLVTGAIGGVIGAVAGDKVGDWLNERKVNRQEDSQGRTWTFDPEQPERGWTHQARTIDTEAMRFQTSDAIRYKTETLTADPALSERLNFQASSTSIELALGAPPRSHDPYSLPAGEQDARSAREAPWTRDPDTWQWSREVSRVVDYRHNSEVYEKQTAQASPQRAAELEQQSQERIARNAGQTPAVMASRFMDAYESRGWAQYGPPPDVVADALRHPGRIVGSDGDIYERSAQGQWTHNGLLWDSEAKGNLRDELETTYRRQQADERIPTLEPVRVTAPPTTSRASMPAPGLQLPDSLKDPAHPGHGSFLQARDAVHRMEFANKIPAGPHSEQLAAAVATRAETEGLRLGSIQLRQGSGDQLDIIERGAYDAPERHVALDTRQALGRSVEAHSHDWSAARSPHYVSQEPAAERTAEHMQVLEQLSGNDRALFDRIRDRVPAHIDDDRVLQAMVQARDTAGIDRPERLGAVEIRGDQLSVVSNSAAGFRATVDLAGPALSMQESLDRNNGLSQQLAQQQAIDAQQREQQGAAMHLG